MITLAPSQFSVACRMEGYAPTHFRVAVYPDGSQRVQGAYPWTQGSAGGVTWRDLPIVTVNVDGQEVING